MYKLLIVDDEPNTREGISSAVNWSKLNIELVGTASDGLEALNIIYNNHTDIIICDIKMPKMDGISLISHVQPKYPNLQVIFLSGHSDKNYLKDAIKLQVIDYIFKPFQIDELLSAVNNAKKKLEKINNDTNSFNYNIALSFVKQGDNSIYINSNPLMKNTKMICLYIKYNIDFESVSDSLIKNNSVKNDEIIFHFFNAFIAHSNTLFAGKYTISMIDCGYVVIANIDEKDESQSKARLNTYLDLFPDIKGKLCIGASKVFYNISEAPTAFSQAKNAAELVFFKGYGEIIFFKEYTETNFMQLEKLIDELSRLFVEKDYTVFKLKILEYINLMKKKTGESVISVKNEVVNTFSSFSFIDKEKCNRIKVLRDLTSMLNLFIIYLDEYITNSVKLDNLGRILYNVEEYIQEHYNHDISITKIAEHVHVTPSYLCHLYKKNTGKTINKFILEIRMINAHVFLTKTDMKIYEIAEKIGYSDQNYFTKAFIKYYNQNPTTYRNTHL